MPSESQNHVGEVQVVPAAWKLHMYLLLVHFWWRENSSST